MAGKAPVMAGAGPPPVAGAGASPFASWAQTRLEITAFGTEVSPMYTQYYK